MNRPVLGPAAGALLLAATALLCSSCEEQLAFGRPCTSDRDCQDGYTCVVDENDTGICAAPRDAGPPSDAAQGDAAPGDALRSDAPVADGGTADAAPADTAVSDGSDRDAADVDAAQQDPRILQLQRHQLVPLWHQADDVSSGLRLRGRLLNGGPDEFSSDDGNTTLRGRLTVPVR